MDPRKSAVRRALLQHWLNQEERSLAWVARHIGTSRHYLSDVMRGKRGFTDRLARRLHDVLGIRFDYRESLESDDEEELPSPAWVAGG
jgi:plasmid maintenance system antidote protein VapI